MSGYGLTYRSIVCYPKLYHLKICVKFFLKKKKTFSLEFVSLRKKNNPHILLLNRGKLSYFIGYRRLDLKYDKVSMVLRGQDNSLLLLCYD